MLNVESLCSRLSSLKWLKAEATCGGLAIRLTVNRPEAMNALNPEVIAELATAFAAIKESNARCMILTGAGDKAFVAGADIKAMTTMTAAEADQFARAGQKAFRLMEQLSCATIAAVNGFALGGGLELALGCDMILATETAKLGLPEVSLGLIPGFGGTQRLARSVGLNRAREMVFSGNFYKAAEAREMGLVNQVYPVETFQAEVEKLATTICQRGPLAIRMAKQAILDGWDAPLDVGMSIEAKHFSELFHSKDQKEGTLAFVQKRAPLFVGE